MMIATVKIGKTLDQKGRPMHATAPGENSLIAKQEAQVISVSRNALYERVWTTAMRRLATEYGLSDVSLAKVCKEHNIPRPPVGYWAKKEVGKAPPRTPLPPNGDPRLETIRFCLTAAGNGCNQIPSAEPTLDDDIQETLRRAKQVPKVMIAETLRRAHHLVLQTKKWFDAKDWDDEEFIRGRQCCFSRPLQIAVSTASLKRALLFMDALLKTVEHLGGTITLGGRDWRPETVVSFCGEKVTTIRLRERYRQTTRQPNAEDHLSWRTQQLVPLGLLLLDTGPSYDTRCHCRDTEKGQRIEDQINELVVGWVIAAGHARLGRRKAEEERKRREEQDRIRQQKEDELAQRKRTLKQKMQAEQARVDQLLQETCAWREARSLREYVQAVEDIVRQRKEPIDEGEFAQWLHWARQQADRLDPLTDSPPSILDELIE